MQGRLLMAEDRDEMMRLTREAAAATQPDLGFCPHVFARTMHDALLGRDLTCFVVEAEPEKLAGFLLCRIDGFFFAAGLQARLLAVWVSPGYRGSRAAAILLDAFFEWSRIVHARQVYLSIDNNPNPQAAARLFARFGARPVGVSMTA